MLVRTRVLEISVLTQLDQEVLRGGVSPSLSGSGSSNSANIAGSPFPPPKLVMNDCAVSKRKAATR